MGLEIAYGEVFEKTGRPEVPNENILKAWAPSHVSELLGDLELNSYYRVRRYGEFRFGTYSSFDFFLEILTIAVGIKEDITRHNVSTYKDIPFFEIFCLAGREGVIGSAAIKELHEDLKTMKPNIELFVNQQATLSEEQKEWFLDRYDMFLYATSKSLNNGFILFE